MKPFLRLISGVLLKENLLHASLTRSLQQCTGRTRFFLAPQGPLGDEALAAKAGGQGSGEELII